MRFLHLSDLHLGKRVNEFSMLEDQAYILKEILNIIDEQKVEAVLIAGDIYDKVIPSAEAVRLLDDFLTRIAARELPVFLISGNHDSAERIAFGSRLMSSRQIYLSPVFESDVEPVTISDRYGEINIYMLPFVKPSLVKRVYPEEEIITYQDAVNAAVQHMQIDTDKRNFAGAGFDADVIRCYQHYKNKGRRGRHLYPLSILRSYFRYRSTGVKVWVDDKLVHNDLLFSVAIGVCKYNGGGVQQLPEAVADDGLLDITLIRPVHWWHVVFRLKRFFNGSIYTIGHVGHYQGRNVRIESSPEMPVEVDGEILGGTPLEFKIRHRCVKVIVNKDFLEG